MPADVVRDATARQVTPGACEGALGSMKSFHGVWAGNVHACLLKSSIGKASSFSSSQVISMDRVRDLSCVGRWLERCGDHRPVLGC